MMLYGLWSADLSQGARRRLRHRSPARAEQRGTFQAAHHGGGVRPSTLFGAIRMHGKAVLNYMLEDENQQLLVKRGNGYALKPARGTDKSFRHQQRLYPERRNPQKPQRHRENSEPFPNIPEGTIWYNYTTTAFGTIFYGDSSGKSVDAEAKLHELANAVRADVARMNEKTERVESPGGVRRLRSAFVLGVSLAFFAGRIAARSRFITRYPKGSAMIGWGLMTPLICCCAVLYLTDSP